MTAMMKHLLTGLAITLMLATGIAAATAQVLPQVSPSVPPPPPPPSSPPPSLAVPQVPKMDSMPAQPAPRVDRRSFNMRFNACQSDATATGLDPVSRTAYARQCANQL